MQVSRRGQTLDFSWRTWVAAICQNPQVEVAVDVAGRGCRWRQELEAAAFG